MSLYPGSQQVAPMRFANKPSDMELAKIFVSDDWVAQEKKDGAWYQLEISDDGERMYLFGRTVSKKTGEYTEKLANVPHIENWALNIPKGTTLIGEIFVPGGKSNDVTKIMGCTPNNAFKRQFETSVYGGPIHYYLFDCIRYGGESLLDTPYIERYEKYLKEQIAPLIQDEYIELAETFYNNFEEHLTKIFAAGGEGMVFKRKDSVYEPNKRPKTSFKYKEHLDSIDLICMNILDPVMEYTGKEIESWQYWYDKELQEPFYAGIGAVENCIQNDKYIPVTKPFFYGWKNAMQLGALKDGKIVEVCKVASGLNDLLRSSMADNPDNYIGQVVEIECMSVNKKDGTVRHPVFKRIREDKDSQDCLYDEIFS